MKNHILFVFGFFLVVLNAKAAPVCGEKELVRDFSKRTGLKPNEVSLIRIDRDLDGVGREEWLLANQDSCGSRGCEYHIYKVDGNCFSHIGEFSGQFQIMDQKVDGYRTFEVTHKDGHLSTSIKTRLQFSEKHGKYLEHNE